MAWRFCAGCHARVLYVRERQWCMPQLAAQCRPGQATRAAATCPDCFSVAEGSFSCRDAGAQLPGGRLGGVVVARLAPQGAGAVISIRDSGPGIPDDHKGMVFRRFYRVETSRSVGGA